ncbi:uncharacterized protein LOC106979711 isoform X5 [Acinonyx jubatus]|uniref:Uncharacterized protein LOC106979711 isoform X5 n=1 Tax=Acinonyx jubatus TaxID=32536 RepID=A0ABM3PID7_ACIJB|nr:uncharacterized protein LOC106979711 isoform X5 [Acinonyx jubatus]
MACPKDGMPLSPGSQNNGTNLKMTVIDKEYEEKESFLCVVTDLCVPAGEKENIQNHLQTWSFLSGGSCDLQTVNPRPHSPDAALCSFTRVAAFPTPPPARRRGSQRVTWICDWWDLVEAYDVVLRRAMNQNREKSGLFQSIPRPASSSTLE